MVFLSCKPTSLSKNRIRLHFYLVEWSSSLSNFSVYVGKRPRKLLQSLTRSFTKVHKLSKEECWKTVWNVRGLKSSDIGCVCSPHRTTIEWAESHNFPPFSQAKMEDTRFVDLKVKVGFPYLYCHQGDCEHLVIITDIRSVLV